VVHAKYDSHFVPPAVPYYTALSIFNYPALERVRVPTLRTGSGVSQPEGGQTVICGYDVMYHGIPSRFRCVMDPLACRFSIRIPIDPWEYADNP